MDGSRFAKCPEGYKYELVPGKILRDAETYKTNQVGEHFNPKQELRNAILKNSKKRSYLEDLDQENFLPPDSIYKEYNNDYGEDAIQPALPHEEATAQKYLERVLELAEITEKEIDPDTWQTMKETMLSIAYEGKEIPDDLLCELANTLLREIKEIGENHE